MISSILAPDSKDENNRLKTENSTLSGERDLLKAQVSKLSTIAYILVVVELLLGVHRIHTAQIAYLVTGHRHVVCIISSNILLTIGAVSSSIIGVCFLSVPILYPYDAFFPM